MSSGGSVSILSCEFCYKVSKAQYLSCEHVMCRRCMDKIISGDARIECPLCMVITYTQGFPSSQMAAVDESNIIPQGVGEINVYKDKPTDNLSRDIESYEDRPPVKGFAEYRSNANKSDVGYVDIKSPEDKPIDRGFTDIKSYEDRPINKENRDIRSYEQKSTYKGLPDVSSENRRTEKGFTDTKSYQDKPTVNSYRYGYQIFVDKPQAHVEPQLQSSAEQPSYNAYGYQQEFIGAVNPQTQTFRRANSRRSSLSRRSSNQDVPQEIPPDLQDILMNYQSKGVKPGFNRTILVNAYDGDQSLNGQDSLSDSPFDESMDSTRSIRYQYVDCSQDEDPFVQSSAQTMYETKMRNSIALEQIKEDLDRSAAKLLKKHQSVLSEISRLTKTEDNAMKNINKLEAMIIQDIQKHHEQLRKSVHYKKEAARLKYKQLEQDINYTIKDVHSKTVKVNHVINNTEDHSINEISTIKEISERTLSSANQILEGTPTDSTFIVDITPGEPFHVDRSTSVDFIYPNLGRQKNETDNVRQAPNYRRQSSTDSTDSNIQPVSNKHMPANFKGTIKQYTDPNVQLINNRELHERHVTKETGQNKYSNTQSFSKRQVHEQPVSQYTETNVQSSSYNATVMNSDSVNGTLDQKELMPVQQRHQLTIKGPSILNSKTPENVKEPSKLNITSIHMTSKGKHGSTNLQETKTRKSGFHAIDVLQNSNPVKQNQTMSKTRSKSESIEPFAATMPLPVLANEEASTLNQRSKNYVSPSEENEVTESGRFKPTRSRSKETHEVISHTLPNDSKREQTLNRLNRTTNDILPTPLSIPTKLMMNTLPDRIRSPQESNGVPMVFAKRRKSTAEILTPTSKSKFETVLYPELIESQFKLEHSVHGLNSKLSCGSPLEVCDNGYKRVWNIKGYTLSTLKREYSSHGTRLEHISSINCVTETPAGYFIVGEDQALNIYDNKGQHVQKITDGHFSSAVIIEDKLYAFDWKLCKLLTLTQYWNNTWKLVDERQFSLDKPCFHDRCVVTNEHVYISAFNNHCIYKYNSTGQLISTFGQKVGPENYNCHTYDPDIEPGLLHYPYLCNVDYEGNLLIADSGNHRLQVCSHDGQWSVLSLDGNNLAAFFPCFVLANDNHIYVLSIQFNKHYHNRQGESGCHDTCSKTFVINMYEKQTTAKLL